MRKLMLWGILISFPLLGWSQIQEDLNRKEKITKFLALLKSRDPVDRRIG